MTETGKLLNSAMRMLAAQPRTIFLGQNVAWDGSAMYGDLLGVPDDQRMELPVCEELQMGMAVGLALQGFLPIAIYPRFDFLLRAMDQLVNHLDKLEVMSCGQFKPKAIIRTRVGGKAPLDAGPQHTQDHTKALMLMLTNVVVCKVTKPDEIMPAYRKAVDRRQSTLVIEVF